MLIWTVLVGVSLLALGLVGCVGLKAGGDEANEMKKEVLARPDAVPPLDRDVPIKTETATFALG